MEKRWVAPRRTAETRLVWGLPSIAPSRKMGYQMEMLQYRNRAKNDVLAFLGRFMFFVGCLAVLSMIVPSCGGGIGNECILDSDCDSQLICAYGYCHTQCADDRDCFLEYSMGAVCIRRTDNGVSPSTFCGVPEYCNTSVDCATGFVCSEKKCFPICSSNNDCLQSQTCFQGACRSNAELPDGGVKPGSPGYPCVINSDCETMLCATNGLCTACRVNGDCFAGALCLRGHCVGDGGFHGPGGTISSSSSSSGDGGTATSYEYCSDCTHVNTGAYWHECLQETTDCLASTGCSSILTCSLNGVASKPACTTTKEGAQCTKDCVALYLQDQPGDSSSVERYYALDSCVYCRTCMNLCTNETVSAADYCGVICAESGSNCPPLPISPNALVSPMRPPFKMIHSW